MGKKCYKVLFGISLVVMLLMLVGAAVFTVISVRYANMPETTTVDVLTNILRSNQAQVKAGWFIALGLVMLFPLVYFAVKSNPEILPKDWF